jgi:hypothetical protein
LARDLVRRPGGPALPVPFFDNLLFTLVAGACVLSAVGSLYRPDPTARAFSAGFAIAAGTYLFLTNGPWAEPQNANQFPSPPHVGNRFITTTVLDLLYTQIGRDLPTVVSEPMITAANLRRLTASGPQGSPPDASSIATRWNMWATPDTVINYSRVGGTTYLQSPDTFRRVGHSLFAAGFGGLAGVLARMWRHRSNAPDREHAG